MRQTLGVAIVGLAMLAAAPAVAQDVEESTAPPRLEVTLIPAGATIFQAKGDGPNFTNYTYGGAVTYNFTPYVGVEGEVGGTAGVSQNLTLGGGSILATSKTPNTLTYNGNLVVQAPTRHALVPFVTGGVGGLTMFARPELGFDNRTTFLTGNVGGGLKWYAANGRWGLRGDYRFIGVRANDQAPLFFGQQTRYGHRVYGAVIINALGR